MSVLRDVQHALAREQGYQGWTELKQMLDDLATARARARAEFDEKVTALLDAYHLGTPAAMERHYGLTWHRREWRGMRRYVQLDLGRAAGSPDIDADITMDDARFLIAREHLFEDWATLVRHCESLTLATATLMKRPVRAQFADGDVEESRDWNATLAEMAERGAVTFESGGQITDAMLEALSSIASLTSIKLNGSSGVTDAGVLTLSRLPHLRHLDLGGTGVTDRGLEVLRELPGLEILSLAGTQASDAGMQHAQGCARLQQVDLQWTRTGDGALRALAGKPELRSLRSGNGVTDAGLGALSDYPVFTRWQGGDAVMSITSYDAQPNYLLLRGPFTDHGLEQLRGLDGLYALNLDARELGITAAGMAPLVSLANLGWLGVDATDAHMPYIAAMPRLRFLGCQDAPAGDDGFEALSRSQSVAYIWGRHCPNLGTRGFAAMHRMPALESLSVSCRNVADAGVAMLPDFPALRELMPIDLPDAGYRHIGRCSNLESLVLMYCRETGDEATGHIAGLARLRKYFASYTRATDRTPELLAGIESLESVTFDSVAALTDAGIAHLARLPRLRELSVSGQGISASVGAPFGPGVKVQRSL
ncbi:MAG: hypothetical protein ABIZ70_14780 [Gemmatimonadales bacterium]